MEDLGLGVYVHRNSATDARCHVMAKLYRNRKEGSRNGLAILTDFLKGPIQIVELQILEVEAETSPE